MMFLYVIGRRSQIYLYPQIGLVIRPNLVFLPNQAQPVHQYPVAMSSVIWELGDQKTRPPLLDGDVYRPDILEIIEKTIDELSPALRELSLDIHSMFFSFV